eukprot:CAMPEP_0117694164 /NCGR_PEP_ID=MMETSP0804-20121206/27297_1 /TAXON_ID=1074897 /ORGANISM="Tetraselmis astigmatica, Strain CCMP880" /LENGTH=214 /DNA_ID=CAMNT_0005507825 /DNA_START=22 /DNA_END=664 /DNA_ORIENTATION=-
MESIFDVPEDLQEVAGEPGGGAAVEATAEAPPTGPKERSNGKRKAPTQASAEPKRAAATPLPRWVTCEVIAAVGAYQAASEDKSQQAMVDLTRKCGDNYSSQCAELSKAGKWPRDNITLEDSVTRRDREVHLRNGKAVISDIVNDILPFVREARAGGTGAEGCRSGDQTADWLAVAKNGYFEKWKVGRTRGVPASVDRWESPEWETYIHFRSKT